MKIRTFISFLWMFVMLLFAGFGSYYLITGENLLTGQKRIAEKPEVLPASDVLEVETESSVEPEQVEVNEKLIAFNEVMSKTSDDTSVNLDATQGGEASVFLRLGKEADTNYIAIFGSGLPEDEIFNVWFIGEEVDPLRLGRLEIIDDSDVYRLAISNADDFSAYSSVDVTLDDPIEEGEEFEYTEDFVVYSGSLDFEDEESTPTPSPTVEE